MIASRCKFGTRKGEEGQGLTKHSDPSDRPTADTLLSQHPFCAFDPDYNFLDTDLYAKIRGAF